MKNPKLANRYAKALFDFANENEQLEVVQQDLVNVSAILKENEQLRVILNSPVIAPTKKHAIFVKVFQDVLHEIAFTFLNVIIRKKREPILASICDEFMKYYNEAHGIKVVEVTSAYDLSTTMIEKIRQTLAEHTRYTIQIQTKVNPQIIGGVLIKMDDIYVDATISSKINKLKQEFAHNIYQVNF